MSDLSHYFWPGLSFVLALLWLWTLLWRGRSARLVQNSVSELMHQRTEVEDVLKAAHALDESETPWSSEKLAGQLGLPQALAEELIKVLTAFGWVETGDQGLMHLTEQGKVRARELVRAHRLWERYLVDREGMSLEAVHAEAHSREHETTAEQLEAMDAGLGYPAWDPHGHVIPAPGHRVPSTSWRSMLEEGTQGKRLRIECLDDESAALLAQFIALGLKPGVDVEVVGREPDLLRLRLNGDIVPLATAAARHIFVVPSPSLLVPLGELPVGSQARVVELQGGGKHQRRMLDMGFVPGAEVLTMRKAPLGDPTEYRVKGTAVALRRQDADTVFVEELGHG